MTIGHYYYAKSPTRPVYCPYLELTTTPRLHRPIQVKEFFDSNRKTSFQSFFSQLSVVPVVWHTSLSDTNRYCYFLTYLLVVIGMCICLYQVSMLMAQVEWGARESRRTSAGCHKDVQSGRLGDAGRWHSHRSGHVSATDSSDRQVGFLVTCYVLLLSVVEGGDSFFSAFLVTVCAVTVTSDFIIILFTYIFIYFFYLLTYSLFISAWLSG